MTATTRPVINLNPIANRYSQPGIERIVEFHSGSDELGRPGGLISFRRGEDGSLSVDLYRLDPHVTIRTSYAGADGAPAEPVSPALPDTAYEPTSGLVDEDAARPPCLQCGSQAWLYVLDGKGGQHYTCLEHHGPTVLAVISGELWIIGDGEG